MVTFTDMTVHSCAVMRLQRALDSLRQWEPLFCAPQSDPARCSNSTAYYGKSTLPQTTRDSPPCRVSPAHACVVVEVMEEAGCVYGSFSNIDRQWDRDAESLGLYVERIMIMMQRRISIRCGRGKDTEPWTVVFEYRPAPVIDACATGTVEEQIENLSVPNPWTFEKMTRIFDLPHAEAANAISTPWAGAVDLRQERIDRWPVRLVMTVPFKIIRISQYERRIVPNRDEPESSSSEDSA